MNVQLPFGLTLNRLSKRSQYLISIVTVLSVSGICFSLHNYIGVEIVAFIQLLTLTVIAMFFDILPVLLTAFLSVVIWQFFFLKPMFDWHIVDTADEIMLSMYFVIALLNAVLTYKIRQIEKIARQKEEKAQVLKLYNTLLSSLSHELRTPIATIIGSTDTLLTDANKLTADDQQNLLLEISIASLRLNRQVENLLNMSRLESGFIEPKKDWCDMNELVYDVLKHLDEQLKSHSIQIDIDENLSLFKLDYGLMEQVLHNLIYNAVQYTPCDSVIKISAESEGDTLVIKVEDNGHGFPEEEIDRAFDKFYRLKNTKAGGTGLGLSIVKGFVEAHKGTITLHNNIHGGATFTIRIPAETMLLKTVKNE
ncbi:MAG TPA: ATP-binding protein [Chitinophagaceae bacterium]|nr:ATP-binding protein [Chitinophagaceae bacterium]